MANINKFLDCLSEIKESKLAPFKKHLVSEVLNENELNSYAVLQTAFVLFNGNMSDNQERLYQFYLPSILQDLILSEVVSQAQEMSDDNLKASIKLLEDKGLVFHFILDVLIFSRLDENLTDEFKSVINSFCHTLSLSVEDIKQVIYLCDCILGIQGDCKPELSDVFYDVIKNPTWLEFFARPITLENVQNLKGGIWWLDKPLELLEGDVSWQDCVVIFNGAARFDYRNGSFKCKGSLLVRPIVKLNNVSVAMDRVDIYGVYNEDEKTTAFDVKSAKSFDVNQSKISTVNARAFSFCQNCAESKFEGTDFYNCGNEYLMGGVAKFYKNVYFNKCNFYHCKAQIGGALFFKYAYPNNIIDCNFCGCVSKMKWGEGCNAGVLYFERPEYHRESSVINCKIKGNISSYYLSSEVYSSYKQELTNTYLEGSIYYSNSNGGYRSMLDKESIILSGVSNSYDKNIKMDKVLSFDELMKKEGCDE